MPKTTRRVVLTFPPEEVEKPLVYRLVKEFDLVPNILKASIRPFDVGTVILELSGAPGNLEKGVEFLEGLGVKVGELSQDIEWNEELCTHCGACTTFCRFGALRYADETLRVEYVPEKCTACGVCLLACPPRAMRGRF